MPTRINTHYRGIFGPNDAAPALAPAGIGGQARRSRCRCDVRSFAAVRHSQRIAHGAGGERTAMAKGRVTVAEAFERSVGRLCGHSEEAAPEEGGVSRMVADLITWQAAGQAAARQRLSRLGLVLSRRCRAQEGRGSVSRQRGALPHADRGGARRHPADRFRPRPHPRREQGGRTSVRRFAGRNCRCGPQRSSAPDQPDGRPDAQSFLSRRTRAGRRRSDFRATVRRTRGRTPVSGDLCPAPVECPLLRASLVDITSQSRAQRELASTAAILAAEHESSPDGDPGRRSDSADHLD